ncbi:toprim domain-containing protein [Candidatus Woesearchaeota archaeon]|nr:toprim domain-containing protein [Candidatus Woesearchaeota archaeon]
MPKIECEELLNLIQQIIDYNLLVIVEGQRDRKALKEFGIEKIMTLDTHHKLVEKITEKEVVLLVDLDKEGKKVYGKLKDLLSRRGVKVNDKLRHYLFRNTHLRQIEGLTRYMRFIKTF